MDTVVGIETGVGHRTQGGDRDRVGHRKQGRACIQGWGIGHRVGHGYRHGA